MAGEFAVGTVVIVRMGMMGTAGGIDSAAVVASHTRRGAPRLRRIARTRARTWLTAPRTLGRGEAILRPATPAEAAAFEAARRRLPGGGGGHP